MSLMMPKQLVAGLEDRVEGLFDAGLTAGLSHADMGHAQHAVQRRAQLVAHDGEELALHLRQPLCLLLGQLELGRARGNAMLQFVVEPFLRLDRVAQGARQAADFVASGILRYGGMLPRGDCIAGIGKPCQPHGESIRRAAGNQPQTIGDQHAQQTVQQNLGEQTLDPGTSGGGVFEFELDVRHPLGHGQLLAHALVVRLARRAVADRCAVGEQFQAVRPFNQRGQRLEDMREVTQ
jgi:hypothetical protein